MSEGGGGMGELTNALKMDQYLYAALCDSSGVTVILAGTMKDVSFWGEGIQNDRPQG